MLSGGFSYHYCTRCTYAVMIEIVFLPQVFTFTEIFPRPASPTLPSGVLREILPIPAPLPSNRNGGEEELEYISSVVLQGVIPGLTDSREAHSCAEFEGMFLVVGGYGHVISGGPNGPPSETFTYQSSGEYYDGVAWHQAESLTTPRAHFALEEMCGSLVSIGGQSGQLEYLDTVERLWTIWNSWIPADYLTLPKPLAYTGSAAVSGLDCWQETA